MQIKRPAFAGLCISLESGIWNLKFGISPYSRTPSSSSLEQLAHPQVFFVFFPEIFKAAHIDIGFVVANQNIEINASVGMEKGLEINIPKKEFPFPIGIGIKG